MSKMARTSQKRKSQMMPVSETEDKRSKQVCTYRMHINLHLSVRVS